MTWLNDRLWKAMRKASFSKSSLLAMLLLLLWTFFPNSIFAQTTPKLPIEWKPKGEQFMLLDFYSNYCSTCKMMEPYLLRLQFTNGKQLNIKHINAEHRETWARLFKYPISGTPTYFLFNSQGQPVYKMERVISPLILQTQVRRALNSLKQIEIPAEASLPKPGKGDEGNWGNMILLAFEHKTGCDNCISHQGELHSFDNVAKNSGLKLIYLDTGKLPGWAEAIRPKELPTYILLDNSSSIKAVDPSPNKRKYGILLNVNGDIDMITLWQNIVLFGNNGLSRQFP